MADEVFDVERTARFFASKSPAKVDTGREKPVEEKTVFEPVIEEAPTPSAEALALLPKRQGAARVTAHRAAKRD